MIRVESLFDKERNLLILKGKGHADYASYNEDIVCASFTTALIVSKNLLERLDKLSKVHAVVEEGKFEFEVKQNDDVIQNILQNLFDTILDLSEQYPKNIKIMK